ncbi:MAG: DUF2889 domain-containing protein [Comamonadaceae bacterium]|nr:MAG: DUF2889 domain-containing protein [Comamonadaceae bacterium]
MPLSPAQPRKHLHTRKVTYRGYYRDDGLWDIEAEITDEKTIPMHTDGRGTMGPGEFVHGMAIRATVNDSMVIVAIESSMDFTPYAECQSGKPPMQAMVGAKMGPGWRQAIERALGGVRGCTHLREMLFNMATAAYQTIPSYQSRLRRERGEPPSDSTAPPYHLGKCIGWDFDGPMVARKYPQFVGWQALKRMPKP